MHGFACVRPGYGCGVQSPAVCLCLYVTFGGRVTHHCFATQCIPCRVWLSCPKPVEDVHVLKLASGFDKCQGTNLHG